ncbi:MAG: peptidase, partial [Bryobacterales bacterium]|nr:peptidase [Bryobacterales bacterium]
NMSSQYTSARRILGAADWQTQLYGVFLQEVKQANSENRGDTGNVPLCYPDFEQVPPAHDRGGNLLAYTKPILVLTDEYTLSAAESFSADLQDAGRATFFGMRTDGGGSDVVSFPVGVYSEGRTRVSLGLETRATKVPTPGFPATDYIENVGIYPDILQDYMTRDNLLNHGAAFFSNAVEALTNLLP